MDKILFSDKNGKEDFILLKIVCKTGKIQNQKP